MDDAERRDHRGPNTDPTRGAARSVGGAPGSLTARAERHSSQQSRPQDDAGQSAASQAAAQSTPAPAPGSAPEAPQPAAQPHAPEPGAPQAQSAPTGAETPVPPYTGQAAVPQAAVQFGPAHASAPDTAPQVPQPDAQTAQSQSAAVGAVGAAGAETPAPAAASPSGRPARTPGPPPPHHHRDVAGGWLRPAVFGAMDGLVTNVSLISGVGAGGGSAHALALTGVAGLVAGAFSMATGEYVSVSSQNELVAREVEAERRELARNPVGEQAELAAALRSHGVEAALAEQVARQISARPDRGLGLHVREELGVDHEDLPSPFTAAGASFGAFSIGALVPLLPYLLGADNLPLALGLSAVAAAAGGGAVGRLTARPVWHGALRQLLLGALAAGATFLIGLAVGTSVG